MPILTRFFVTTKNGTAGGTVFSLRLAALTLALGYWIYRYIQRRRRYQIDKAFGDKHGCQPIQTTLPYEWPWALDILKKQYDQIPNQHMLAFLAQYLDKWGPNLKLHLFGDTGYLTTDPKNIESILSTRFEDWVMGSRRDGLFPFLGEGIFTQDGRAWKHSREMLRRQFVRMHYHDIKLFDKQVNELLARLSVSSGIVDLQPELFRFTLATTTALIFGEPVTGLDGEDEDTFAESFDYCSLITAIRLRLTDFCWLYSPSKFKNACQTVKRYVNHFVSVALKDQEENGEERASERHAFILDLYKQLQDPERVRDQLVNVLIAGRDTTACLMSWTFFLLVRHPVVLFRLRKEIVSIAMNGEDLARTQITKLKYLRCVLNETLRLYPQVPINVRIAKRTTLIPSGGGADGASPVLIPKGTGVGYSVYHMHRRKEIFGEDAHEFKPERWEGDLAKRIGWGFIPFHGGPRICLGKDFALTEASYGIVRVLQAFPNLRLPPGLEVDPTGQEKQSLTMVVSSAEGCRVLLE